MAKAQRKVNKIWKIKDVSKFSGQTVTILAATYPRNDGKPVVQCEVLDKNRTTVRAQ
jgi:hypothetical protein